MIRNRFLPRHLAVAMLACLAVASPGRAAPTAHGHALIIGISGAGGESAKACPAVAASLRDRLASQGLQVSLASDPGQVAFRAALDDFAAAVGRAGVGTTLIYVCAPAVVSDTRLFVLAHAGEPGAGAGPETQGIVAPALLNTLAGTGGTLYADLDLPTDAQSDQAILLLGRRLPADTHLVIARSDRSALVGEALAGDAGGVTRDWAAQASALAARAQTGQVHLTLEPPVLTLKLPVLPLKPSVPTPKPPAASAAHPGASLLRVTIPVAATQAPLDPAPALPTPAVRPNTAPQSLALGQIAVPQATAAGPGTALAVTRPAISPGRLVPLPMVAVSALPTPPAKMLSGEARLAGSLQAHHKSTGRAADPPGVNRRVARVQAALIRIGLYHGPLDGDLDGETLMAIRTFQHRLGDPASGSLSGKEIVRLLNP